MNKFLFKKILGFSFILVFSFCSCSLGAKADEPIQAGVKYNEASARIEAFSNVQRKIEKDKFKEEFSRYLKDENKKENISLNNDMVKDLYKIDEEGLNYYKYETLSDGPEMKGFVMNYHNKLNNIELNEEMKERFINEVANSYVYNIAISNELDFIRFNR